MTEEREQRIRDLAYRMWEEDGRPEGRAAEYWQRAEAEVGRRQPADATPAPDDAQSASPSGSPAADPVRNPEPIPAAQDPTYPAVTGPEEVPPFEGAGPGLNPEEIVAPRRATRPPSAAERVKSGGTRRTGGSEVKLRRRPGNTSPDS